MRTSDRDSELVPRLQLSHLTASGATHLESKKKKLEVDAKFKVQTAERVCVGVCGCVCVGAGRCVVM